MDSAKFRRLGTTLVVFSSGARARVGGQGTLVFPFRGCWGPSGTRDLLLPEHSPGGAVRGLGGFFPPSRAVRTGLGSLSPNIGWDGGRRGKGEGRIEAT